MNKTTCPICATAMPADWSEYPDYPFCSRRCRLIDLGRWLGEGYRIPDSAAPVAPPPDEPSPTAR